MLFQTTKSIISKIGATKELGTLFKKSSWKNTLIVTDEGVVKLDLLKDAIESLQKENVNITIFDKIRPDPPEYLVNDVLNLAKDKRIDSVIGFGGGSPMDVAKLVAYLSSGENNTIDISEIYGVDNCKSNHRLPLMYVGVKSYTYVQIFF